MARTRGALPDREIHSFIRAGFIKGPRKDAVQPASLDVALSSEIYRINGVFLPRPHQTVRDALKARETSVIHAGEPLEVGVTYCIRLADRFALPREVYAYANPKSSTGRCDLTTQIVADEVDGYDTLPPGFRGEVWVMVTPDSFPVVLSEGDKTTQLRFFDGDARLDNIELEALFAQYKIMYFRGKPIELSSLRSGLENGRLVFTIDLRSKVVGYRARSAGYPLVFNAKGRYRVNDFFEPIACPERGELIVRRGEFMLLQTREGIRVPPHIAAEVEALDSRSGAFIAHKAGFIDGGYGYGSRGEQRGLPITLEVRAARDMVLHHGQRVCRVAFEALRHPPVHAYSGHYRKRRMLPKQFKVG